MPSGLVVGHANNFKIEDFKIMSGQMFRDQPWSAYLSFGGYAHPNGKDINKTMTTVDRLFRIHSQKVINEVFKDDLPKIVLKDVQWSDSDHVDLSSTYSYTYYELTFIWSKNKKINIKKDKRFELVARELVKWLTNSQLISFVAKRPEKVK
jgi:hypothetical protein